MEDDEHNLVGISVASHWAQFHAENGDYDVKVTRDEGIGFSIPVNASSSDSS